MSNFCSVRAKIIAVDQGPGSVPASLMQRLTEFTQQHYEISNESTFIESILRPQQAGSVIIYYGETDEIVGYSRAYRQRFPIKGKLVNVYSAKTYHNRVQNLNFITARLGLTEAMKFKLCHPEEELVYISCIDTPYNYQFLAQLPNSIYPQSGVAIPKHVLELVKMMKEKNNWSSCPGHPMLINGQLKKRRNDPIPSQCAKDPLVDYYLSLNPAYANGSALLAYIPLNLGNIAYALRQLITQAQHDVRLPHLNHSLILSA